MGSGSVMENVAGAVVDKSRPSHITQPSCPKARVRVRFRVRVRVELRIRVRIRVRVRVKVRLICGAEVGRGGRGKTPKHYRLGAYINTCALSTWQFQL